MDRIIQKTLTKRQDKQYFTQQTEKAILRYNDTNDYRLKNQIYEKDIHYPFFKLTQNIIHNFKFYHTDVNNLEHLQHEITIFLLSKIHLFHHSISLNRKFKKIITKKYKEEYPLNSFIKFTNNSVEVNKETIVKFVNTLNVSDECKDELIKITPPKAFSYFGTITKRYLINYNDNNYKKKINNISISEIMESPTSLTPEGIITLPNKDLNFLKTDEDDDLTSQQLNPNDKLSTFMDLYIQYCTKNIYNFFPKKNDSQIADAILELFRKRENIEIFNKKALYLYIREIIDVKTPKITQISKKLHEIFQKKYIHYLESGEFSMDD